MAESPESLRVALADRYTLRDELGRGGMATVYLADDLRHHRRVALKVLHSEVAAAVGRERFLREIAIVSQLNHPHILPLLDSGEAGEHLYYAMPCVEGESLQKRIAREGQLPLDDVIAIARDVAQALACAHEHGIVHRDVKPGNILLSGRSAVIADFGIARIVGQAADEGHLTTTGITVGTPLYMAPEQSAGARTLDGRADQYALACVVYEMIAGTPPFTGSTTQAIQARHALDPPPPLHTVRPGVPSTVERAVLRGLAKVPADRFQTPTDFVGALKADPTTDGGRARPMRWLMAVVAAVSLGGSLIIGLSTWRRTAGSGQNRDLNRIAVLYFADRSADGSLQAVGDAFTEDLVQALSQVEVLRVASISQVRPFRGMSPPLDSITRVLDVGALVEGVVTGTSARPRLDVRLVDAATGEVLASPSVERPRAELLEMRNQLVDEIANALRRELGEEVLLRQRRTESRSPEAWILIQRVAELNRYAVSLSLAGDGEAGRRAFEEADSLAARAARLDPRWIEPVLRRGWLARSRAVVVATRDAQQAERWLRTGLDYAERAIAMSHEDGRPLELRGVLKYYLGRFGSRSGSDTLLAQAERDLRGAVRANPSLAASWYTLSEILSFRGEFTEAEAAARKALEKDAYLSEAQQVIGRLFWATLNRGDFAEAERWCEQGRNRFADDPNFVECRLTVLGWSGRTAANLAAAWQELQRIGADDRLAAGAPYRWMHVAAVLARGGWSDSANAVVREARRRFPNEEMNLEEAYVRLLLDERDDALRLLAIDLQRHPDSRGYVLNHYWFRALQDDERFQALSDTGSQPGP